MYIKSLKLCLLLKNKPELVLFLKKIAFLNWDTSVKAHQEQTSFTEWQREAIKTVNFGDVTIWT